jgi:hypothetical protein
MEKAEKKNIIIQRGKHLGLTCQIQIIQPPNFYIIYFVSTTASPSNRIQGSIQNPNECEPKGVASECFI